MKLKLMAGTTSSPLPSLHPLVMPPTGLHEDMEATGWYNNTLMVLRYDQGNTLMVFPCIADSQRVHTRHVGQERSPGACFGCSTSSGHVP